MQRQQWKKWEKVEKIPGCPLTKVWNEKEQWSKKQGISAEKFISCHWWISVISRIRSLRFNIKSTKAESCSEVTLWKMIQDHTQYLLNKDHQHHTWQPQKSWTLFQDYQDAQDKQQMQYPLTAKSKWKMHRRFWKFQSQNVQIFGYVYRNTNGPNHGPVWKTQLFFLEEICTVIFWQDYSGKSNSRKFYEYMVGESSKLGMFIRSPRKKDYSCLYTWTTKNLLARNRTSTQCGKYSWKTLIGRIQHHFLTMFIWVAPKDNVRWARILWIITEVCSNQGFLLVLWKNSETKATVKLDAETISSWSYDMEGHAKKCVEIYCQLANKTTHQLYKVSTTCMDDHSFGGHQLENWPQFAHKLFWNVYIWLVLCVDMENTTAENPVTWDPKHSVNGPCWNLNVRCQLFESLSSCCCHDVPWAQQLVHQWHLICWGIRVFQAWVVVNLSWH